MTVLNTTMQNNYAGNGVAASFAFTFKVYRAEDLSVLTINNSTGAVTPLVLGVDYTVNEYGLDTGGQITLTAGALAAGNTIWLTRIMSRTQETNFSNQGAYLPENTEETLDQQDMMAIEDLFRFNRALTIPLTDVPLSVLPTATLRASMYLGFDVTGQPVMLSGTGGIGNVNENQLVLSDVTTANVSITKHGFAPKAPNDATKFLRGDATWAVPLPPTEAAIFTANGNFTPLVTGNYLVIGYGGGGGGGGGGGTNTVSGGSGGAGGGGGSVSASVVALVAGTPYAVVIGTGGGGGAAGGVGAGGGDGTAGNNTTFNGVTIGAGGSGGRGNSANVSNTGVGLAGATGGGNGGAAGGAKIGVSNNNGNAGANAPANTAGGGGGGGGGATSGGTNGGGAGGNGGSGYLTVVRC